MANKMIFLCLYFLSPLIPIIIIDSSNPDRYSDINILIPMILGAFAYTWLIAEFILSARPKWIERYFGLDKFYRFHGMMALTSIILVFIHKITEEMVMGRFLTSEVGDQAFFIFLGVVVAAVIFMTDTYLQPIKPLFAIKKYLTKFRIAKYQYQRLIHNLSAIGLLAMFVHVMMTTSARMFLSVRLVYFGYFGMGVGFYLYHKIIKRYLLRKKYTIQAVIVEAPNMWTLRLVPNQGTVFPYKPGQFGFIRIFSKGIPSEEHPFSISSAPNNLEYLSITIKDLGDYTANIKNIKPGDTAHIDAPYGRFSYLYYPAEESTVLIAGGVGITPMLSMLRHMYSQESGRKVILFWGINHMNELIFQAEFAEWQNVMPNFTFIPVVFDDQDSKGEKGIIDKEKIEAALKKDGHHFSSTGFYICGPAMMMKAVIKSLKMMGVNRSRIHYENFSL